MGKIRIRPAARADVLEIWTHIAEDNLPSADALSEELDDVITMLGRRPKAGRLRSEFGTGMRSLAAGIT